MVCSRNTQSQTAHRDYVSLQLSSSLASSSSNTLRTLPLRTSFSWLPLLIALSQMWASHFDSIRH